MYIVTVLASKSFCTIKFKTYHHPALVSSGLPANIAEYYLQSSEFYAMLSNDIPNGRVKNIGSSKKCCGTP